MSAPATAPVRKPVEREESGRRNAKLRQLEIIRQFFKDNGVEDSEWGLQTKRQLEQLIEMTVGEKVTLYTRVWAYWTLHAMGWLPTSAGLESDTTVANPARAALCKQHKALVAMTKNEAGEYVPATTMHATNELNSKSLTAARKIEPQLTSRQKREIRIRKEDVRRVTAQLEEDGFGFRCDLQGTPLRKLREADPGKLRQLAHGGAQFLVYLKPKFSRHIYLLKPKQPLKTKAETKPETVELHFLRKVLRDHEIAGDAVALAQHIALRPMLDRYVQARDEEKQVRDKISTIKAEITDAIVHQFGSNQQSSSTSTEGSGNTEPQRAGGSSKSSDSSKFATPAPTIDAVKSRGGDNPPADLQSPPMTGQPGDSHPEAQAARPARQAVTSDPKQGPASGAQRLGPAAGPLRKGSPQLVRSEERKKKPSDQNVSGASKATIGECARKYVAIDDDGVGLLIRNCRTKRPGCTDAEICAAIDIKGPEARTKKNPSGWLLEVIPKWLAGNGNHQAAAAETEDPLVAKIRERQAKRAAWTS